MKKNNYKRFIGMLIFSFCVMYSVMYLNVEEVNHIYLSTTRLYMSLLMVSPMALLMLLFMPEMYSQKTKNAVIVFSSVAVFILALIFLRKQSFISDKQYMQGMIPHHSSAILTSKHANIKDPEVKRLAQSIIKSQEREIQQMKMILKRMKE